MPQKLIDFSVWNPSSQKMKKEVLEVWEVFPRTPVIESHVTSYKILSFVITHSNTAQRNKIHFCSRILLLASSQNYYPTRSLCVPKIFHLLWNMTFSKSSRENSGLYDAGRKLLVESRWNLRNFSRQCTASSSLWSKGSPLPQCHNYICLWALKKCWDKCTQEFIKSSLQLPIKRVKVFQNGKCLQVFHSARGKFLFISIHKTKLALFS